MSFQLYTLLVLQWVALCACSPTRGPQATSQPAAKAPARTAGVDPCLLIVHKDSDADSDGIRRADDMCPCEPETINRHEDRDGCPDRLSVPIIRHGSSLLGPISFPHDGAEIPRAQRGKLKAMLAKMGKGAGRLTCLGYAHRTEKHAHLLSLLRARAVAREMAYGISDGKIFVCGDTSNQIGASTPDEREVMCYIGYVFKSGCLPYWAPEVRDMKMSRP